jgi:hypothetical protein
MDALIVYGSLINKSELIESGFPLGSTHPVVVQGFKRVFRQEPSWRSDQGEQRAVLNAISAEQHWLNALLVSGLDEGFLVDLDKREKGYNRIRVAPSYLRDYHFPRTTPRNIYMHIGKADKQSDSILPNSSYLSMCLEGAKHWGEDFYNDFLDSTFVEDNVLLRTYIEK